MLQNPSLSQVGNVDLVVNRTETLVDEIPYAVRELDHVLGGKSFPTAPYARRHSLGSFEIQLDPGESGYWVVLIPLHPEDVDHPALMLRDNRQQQPGNSGPIGAQ